MANADTHQVDTSQEFHVDLKDAVIRSSELEQKTFNLVWKVQGISSQFSYNVFLVSPIFTDPATGNEWRLKLKQEHSYLAMAVQLTKFGNYSGEIIQMEIEVNFLDSRMKKSLYRDRRTSNAHQRQRQREGQSQRPQVEDDFFSTVYFTEIHKENSPYFSNEKTLTIHFSLITTYMQHNPNHNENSSCSQKHRKPGNPQMEILTQQLENLWPNDKFSDVTLVGESGTAFPASKIILAANSPVFYAMFNSEMKEAVENQVKIPGFSEDVIQGFLEFVYTGNKNGTGTGQVLKKNAAELLKFAEKYDIKHLKEECEWILIQNLTTDNAADLLYLASFFNSPALKEKVVEFFKRYRKEVQNTRAFQQMKKENPQVLIEFYTELN